jgi:O-antigen biosynthesis protein
VPGLLNPLEHPVCLEDPQRQAASAWVEHIPFAMWLSSVLRPRMLVELGTYHGTSYCAFCQAIHSLKLPTRAFAVDTWKGDPHNGFTGPEVLQELRDHHDPRYGNFSTLLPMTFDEAASRFSNGEIDLLHIDGYHTYEAVRHDFDTWLSKLSDRGVILFHDVGERILDFGVWKLWEELTARYPSFTFQHEHGLGVLVVGHDLPSELRTLVELNGEEIDHVRTFFEQLGRRVRLQTELDATKAQRDAVEADRDVILADREARRIQVEQQLDHLHSVEQENLELQQVQSELRARIQWDEQQMAELRTSLSWHLIHRISDLGARVAPIGSTRRQILNWARRLGRVAGR